MSQRSLLSAYLFVVSTTFHLHAMTVGDKLFLHQDRFRYAARAMYDGTGFKGWQTQDTDKVVRTVQEMIGKQLCTRYDTKITVTGASRTDLGVHARGQALHFDLPKACEDLKYLEFQMNRMLPDDVRVFNISEAPRGTEHQVRDGEKWHATKSATAKLYIYRFCTNAYVDPMRKRYCTHVYQHTDMVLLEKCLNTFVGTHDFQGFANKVARLTRVHEELDKEFCTIRTVNSIKLIDDGEPGYYRIEFNLKSALYRMVRSVVSSLTTSFQ